MPEDEIEISQCPNPSQNDTVKADVEDSGFFDNISDFYVLGKLWIDMLKIGLLGTESVVPIITAAPAGNTTVECPQIPTQESTEPPKMRYKDLPIYTSPHFHYKDRLDRKDICPKAQEKLLHKFILPRVKSCRLRLRKNYSDFTSEMNSLKREAKRSLNESSCKVTKFMREPENVHIRGAVVVFGGLSGCLGNSTFQKIFVSGAGLLATGALCFPKETDVIFRDISYALWKVGVQLTNIDCAYRERSSRPCDLNPEPPSRTPNQFCPDVKAKPCLKKDEELLRAKKKMEK